MPTVLCSEFTVRPSVEGTCTVSRSVTSKMIIEKCTIRGGVSIANDIMDQDGTIECTSTLISRSTTSAVFRSRLIPVTTKGTSITSKRRTLPRTPTNLHAGLTRATFFCPRLHAGRRKRISFSFAVPRDLAH